IAFDGNHAPGAEFGSGDRPQAGAGADVQHAGVAAHAALERAVERPIAPYVGEHRFVRFEQFVSLMGEKRTGVALHPPLQPSDADRVASPLLLGEGHAFLPSPPRRGAGGEGGSARPLNLQSGSLGIHLHINRFDPTRRRSVVSSPLPRRGKSTWTSLPSKS